MTYEIATSPFAWIVAVINFSALVTALGCSAFLAFRKKDKAWLPIFAAVVLAYGLSYVSRIRNGRIPAVPYARVSTIESSTGPIRATDVSYSFDLLAIGIACSAIIALRRN